MVRNIEPNDQEVLRTCAEGWRALARRADDAANGSLPIEDLVAMTESATTKLTEVMHRVRSRARKRLGDEG